MKILVTGGCGYIGSHTVLELLFAGHDVVVIDNLVNSSAESIKRVEQLSGRPVTIYYSDLCDFEETNKIFQTELIDAVIHFAGLKAVGKSIEDPLLYYSNNLYSTLVLCQAMAKNNVKRLVFSSSATVYGDPEKVPITENSSLGATNPYGRTKLMIEEILQDLVVTKNEWQITILRYFNPIGAHDSGRIGEDPNGVPNNLLPYVAQVAVGRLEVLSVHGDDYPTPDGTGIRDYIHVVDLAQGHLAALEKLPQPNNCAVYNLGTGQGSSVLEVIAAFKAASGKDIRFRVGPRRPGDIASCYADVSKVTKDLGWIAKYDLQKACVDAWRWQTNNPNGYSDS